MNTLFDLGGYGMKMGVTAVDTSAAGCRLAASTDRAEERIIRSNGADLWFKLAGKADGPVVVYLHGGPGYNSHTFEKAVGALLEQKLKMIYLDQRGCGRSSVPLD